MKHMSKCGLIAGVAFLVWGAAIYPLSVASKLKSVKKDIP